MNEVTVGELVEEFADQIPLHSAARKWTSRGGTSTAGKFASPDHMRFYSLTQYLHWLQCRFRNADGARNKTRETVVIIHARTCPKCGKLFVQEKKRQSCGVRCE
jgi:hypothetical protein